MKPIPTIICAAVAVFLCIIILPFLIIFLIFGANQPIANFAKYLDKVLKTIKYEEEFKNQSNWAQKDPKKDDFIGGKPNIDNTAETNANTCTNTFGK
jgi:predicted PurR-regulated permease PerM